MIEVIAGDCLEALPRLPADSVDACVTDPPYGLSQEPDIAEVLRHWLAGDDYKHRGSGFMGKSWDSFVPGPSYWREVFRVLKPGAHLLCFAGTRTQDLMGIALRMAGFEIRDCIRYEQGREAWPAWVYGTGFPKSLNVSYAIDDHFFHEWLRAHPEQASKLKGLKGDARKAVEDELRRVAGLTREVIGESQTRIQLRDHKEQSHGGWHASERTPNGGVPITAPATPEAAQWTGWGTALKPSHEPVIIARKPYTSEREWATIRDLSLRLWSRLWLLLPASVADGYSRLSPADCGVDPHDSAQWSVGHASSLQDDLSALMGMSRFASATISSLSIVSSWNATLAAYWQRESTFTTETGLNTTIDSKTLKSCLSQTTPENIILAHRSGAWSNADASHAARYLNATVAVLSATRELSALGNAIAPGLHNCPDADAKPAYEPVLVARKPLSERTVAANVLKYGCGALNIDACRVEAQGRPLIEKKIGRPDVDGKTVFGSGLSPGSAYAGATDLGRWPANLIHDDSQEVLDAFAAFGERESRGGRTKRAADCGFRRGGDGVDTPNYGVDTGSAARFFMKCEPDEGDRLQHALSCLLWRWEVDIVSRQVCGDNQCRDASFAGAGCQPAVRGERGGSALAYVPVNTLQDCEANSLPKTERAQLADAGSEPSCQITHGIVPLSAEQRAVSARDLNADSAASPPGSCATPTAPSLARARIRSASGLKERFTSATESELRKLAETLIATMRSIESASSLGSQQQELSLTLGHARSAAAHDLTGTITITISHWRSDGSAEPVTFSIMQTNSAHGDLDLVEASRFHYSAKASKADRMGTTHPTTKPVSLIEYLCRLVTPPGGTVLDPFAGSGPLVPAARRLGINAILIEREPEYIADIERRIANDTETARRKDKPPAPSPAGSPPTLFDAIAVG